MLKIVGRRQEKNTKFRYFAQNFSLNMKYIKQDNKNRTQHIFISYCESLANGKRNRNQKHDSSGGVALLLYSLKADA
jgi:hypothetical protein